MLFRILLIILCADLKDQTRSANRGNFQDISRILKFCYIGTVYDLALAENKSPDVVIVDNIRVYSLDSRFQRNTHHPLYFLNLSIPNRDNCWER